MVEHKLVAPFGSDSLPVRIGEESVKMRENECHYFYQQIVLERLSDHFITILQFSAGELVTQCSI